MKRAIKKIREGMVVSDKMTKTIVVEVERALRHPLFQKVLKRSKKFKVHDEGEICSVGDKVRIMESRPMSRGKRWIVLEIIGKKKEQIEEQDKGLPAPVRRTAAEEKEKTVDTD